VCRCGHEPERIVSLPRAKRPDGERAGTLSELECPCQGGRLTISTRRHLSRRTEEAYVARIRCFIFFHNERHPAEMGAPEVTKFLTSLAVVDIRLILRS
jgi:hypothetical protein